MKKNNKNSKSRTRSRKISRADRVTIGMDLGPGGQSEPVLCSKRGGGDCEVAVERTLRKRGDFEQSAPHLIVMPIHRARSLCAGAIWGPQSQRALPSQYLSRFP